MPTPENWNWKVGSVCASRHLGNGTVQGMGLTRSRDLELGGAKVWVHLGVAAPSSPWLFKIPNTLPPR